MVSECTPRTATCEPSPWVPTANTYCKPPSAPGDTQLTFSRSVSMVHPTAVIVTSPVCDRSGAATLDGLKLVNPPPASDEGPPSAPSPRLDASAVLESDDGLAPESDHELAPESPDMAASAAPPPSSPVVPPSSSDVLVVQCVAASSSANPKSPVAVVDVLFTRSLRGRGAAVRAARVSSDGPGQPLFTPVRLPRPRIRPTGRRSLAYFRS